MSDDDQLPAMMAHTIADLPSRWARATPHAPALRDAGVDWTYAALARAIDEAQTWVAQRGVGPGDRIMIVNENCRALVALIFAAARCGAWAAAVNARLAPNEIDAIVAHADPRLVAFTSGASSDADAHRRRLAAADQGPASLGGVVALHRPQAAAEPAPGDPRDGVAALIYTSGTTGTPKAVMLTQRNLLFIAATSARLREITPADRVYGALPISHVFGLASMLLATLHAGASIDLVARFSAEAAIAALSRETTVFQGVPAMYARILEHLSAHEITLRLPKIRYISAGGSPLDPALKGRVEKAFGMPLHNGYGLTECAPTVSQTRMDDPKRDSSTGPPIPGIAIELRDVETRAPVREGEVGQLWVRGPNVMKGYFRDPRATAEILTADRWLNTGDLARVDRSGSIHIVGRTRELIIRSGFNVYPPDVEAAIVSHPDVTQCAVVGRPVEGNEEVVAFVELRPGATIGIADLARHAAERLAAYKRPSEIVILESLPASPTGKVLKRQLRELACSARQKAPIG
ncbi:MAG TPA: AMP-binding protein [Alphaproteobacteria bacterium]|nr:AMP-binding protein [Alphaproteobacteria bacterium]